MQERLPSYSRNHPSPWVNGDERPWSEVVEATEELGVGVDTYKLIQQGWRFLDPKHVSISRGENGFSLLVDPVAVFVDGMEHDHANKFHYMNRDQIWDLVEGFLDLVEDRELGLDRPTPCQLDCAGWAERHGEAVRKWLEDQRNSLDPLGEAHGEALGDDDE